MRLVLFILVTVPILTMVWWAWTQFQLWRMDAHRGWSVAVALFAATFLAAYVWTIFGRTTDVWSFPHPWITAFMMLWALIFLPLVALPHMLACSAFSVLRRSLANVRRRGSRSPAPDQAAAAAAADPDTAAAEYPASSAAAAAGYTRREVLRAAFTTLPMLTTLGATAYSIPQKRRFRIRELTLHLPTLPTGLDGLTIAHLTDIHVGKFTRGPILDRIADATNDLGADLVLLTGDLLDHTVSDLPHALAMLDRIDRRRGLFMVEGNHDLFQGRPAFADPVRAHGIPLLLDETATVTVRDHRVQIMGIHWARRAADLDRHVDFVAALRDPSAFPILLTHHPHAFDRAVHHRLPLTLAGHTHGGQLMLTPDLGAGPAMFKYWSGLYERDGTHLAVSNGAGNWFPLRTNAPAEILHLTLRSSAAPA